MSEHDRSRDGQAGLTLIELVVAMSLFGLVIAVVFGVLSSVQQSTTDLLARADATSAAQLALQQVDRNVRSASYIAVPGGTKLNVLTRVNDGLDKCMQWQVVGGSLATATWSPGTTPPAATTWRRTAADLVNGPSEPVFVSGAAGLQSVTVRLKVKGPKAGGKPAEVQTSVSGRNAAAGTATPTCSFP